MTEFGYTMMCEQSEPKQLVADLVGAEQAGFAFSVISDHFQPWLESQGHSPYAWSVLGAAAQATETIGLMTYVTCPTLRYHPVVVAQKAATVQLLSDGRVNYQGKHFDVESAKLWDRPGEGVPIGIAVSGPDSCRLAGHKADIMIAVQSDPELGEMFDRAGGAGKPRVAQVALAYDKRKDRAVKRAHDQFRWFGLGWKVNADLPNPDGFAAATQFVTEEQVSEQIACGPDVEEHVEKIRPYLEAGFDEIALLQIGGDDQSEFIDWAGRELLPALEPIGRSAQTV